MCLFSVILTSDSVKYSSGNIAWSIGTRVVVVIGVGVVDIGGRDDGCAGFVGLGGRVGGSA